MVINITATPVIEVENETRIPTALSSTPRPSLCGKDQQLKKLDEDSVCLLFTPKTGPKTGSKIYKEIICVNPSAADLRQSLEFYAADDCGLPLKIYISELNFYPTPAVFESVAPVLNTLIIKSWNPHPVAGNADDENVMLDKGLIVEYELNGKAARVPVPKLRGAYPDGEQSFMK